MRGKRHGQSVSKSKQPIGCQSPNLGQIDEESKVFSSLTEQIGLSTIAKEDTSAIIMTDTTSLRSYDSDSCSNSWNFPDNVSISNSDISFSFSSYSLSTPRSYSDVVADWEAGSASRPSSCYSSRHSSRPTSRPSSRPASRPSSRPASRTSSRPASRPSSRSPSRPPSLTACPRLSCSLSGPPSRSGTSVEQTSAEDVLEAVDIKREGPLHELDGWETVSKKESRREKLDYPSKQQYLPEDDYQKFRYNAEQHRKTANDFSKQAKISRASRKWNNANYFDDQEKIYMEMAQKANETASEAIFDSRFVMVQRSWQQSQPAIVYFDVLLPKVNEKFENSMAINLHGQNEKEGMQILKRHLVFAVYRRSLRHLRVIIEHSKLKQSVVDLLKGENIKCKEENTGFLLITFDGKKRELLFMKSEDDDCEGGFFNSAFTASSNASSASISIGSIGSMSSQRSRRKKVISLSGSVSSIKGKEDLSSSSNNTIGVKECNAVEKVQAWEAMSDLTKPSNTSEDVTTMFGTSYPASYDKSFLGGNRSLTSSEQTTEDMSEPLDALEKRLRNELQLEQRLDYPSPTKQHIPGDDCQNQKKTTNQYQDSAKTLKEKVRLASENKRWSYGKEYHNRAWEAMPKSSNTSEDVMAICGTSSVASSSNIDLQEDKGGNRSYASVVANCGSHPPSEQATRDMSEAFYAQEKGLRDKLQTRMSEKKAQQSDEWASQDVFDSRNQGINNRIEIDLHGQHLGEGMKMLKHHLIFGVYQRSLWQLRVITGYGSHGTGPSVLRKAVVRLLQKEKITHQKEGNRGSFLITFDGKKKDLSFGDCHG